MYTQMANLERIAWVQLAISLCNGLHQNLSEHLLCTTELLVEIRLHSLDRWRIQVTSPRPVKLIGSTRIWGLD